MILLSCPGSAVQYVAHATYCIAPGTRGILIQLDLLASDAVQRQDDAFASSQVMRRRAGAVTDADDMIDCRLYGPGSAMQYVAHATYCIAPGTRGILIQLDLLAPDAVQRQDDAFASSQVMRRRAGAVTDADDMIGCRLYGPGSARQHVARATYCIAPGTRGILIQRDLLAPDAVQRPDDALASSQVMRRRAGAVTDADDMIGCRLYGPGSARQHVARATYCIAPGTPSFSIGCAMDLRFIVYILANCRRGVLYVGVTNNIGRRISEHRAKLLPAFTEEHGVVLLVHVEEYASILEARARERSLKRWRRAWKFALIEKDNPEWRDLSDDISF